MNRDRLVQTLEEIATFMDLLGENPFKIRAYQNAARIIEKFDGDLESSVRDGSIGEVKGIGPALKEKITQFVNEGKITEHENLKAKVPAGLVDMLTLPGLGPKKARALHDKLGIDSIGELELACRRGRLVDLDGFGEKTQAKILKSIEFVKKHQNTFLYSDAVLEAQVIVDQLKTVKGLELISVGGSLRRKKEIVKDIDIVVGTNNAPAVAKKFLALKNIQSITGQGDTKISIVLDSGIAVDLRMVTPEQYPYALVYFTGNKEHNVALRQITKVKDLKLNEYSLEGKKTIKCKTEEDVYKALGLRYIPPELRENMGEIEAAEKGKLPVLIEREQLRGVFHCHTVDSDGVNSLEDMVGAAQKLGFEYIGISDHSVSSEVYANGMKKDRVLEQFKRIDSLQKKFKIKIFKGIECDILADGRMDYDDEFLAKFDFVIGSLHAAFTQTQEKMTDRVLKAMANPYFDILGHPTARLLLAREPVNFNMNEIITAAVKNGVVVELNSHPQRLDMDWRYGKFLKEKKGKVSINPDAHSVAGLEDVEYGIGIARKGWLSASEVVNTLPAKDVLKSFRSYAVRR